MIVNSAHSANSLDQYLHSTSGRKAPRTFPGRHCPALLLVLLLFVQAARAANVNWLSVGPDGGDARSFAVDPTDHNHLYMGTVFGWIYESVDGGSNWVRLAQLGNRYDQTVDHILIDRANPRHILAGAWLKGGFDGGLYSSNDGGRTWIENPQMTGQSIRSLTAAPSDPKIIVAGAISGVFRSMDSGATWERISPVGDKEVHEIESLAIDPVNPDIIYAGTWHLPWKTTDGGKHWISMDKGIIVDSDVFSIIIDPTAPATMYLSACSGIYKSVNTGSTYVKVQGIPSAARRTRVLVQDPQHPNTVYAGTTEGLWRTSDAGHTWMNTTANDIVINDIYVDPTAPDHVLLATDHGGVLSSTDGGFSFRSSNRGFSGRQITAYAADERNPARLYIGVVNDQQAGGVFASDNGGLTWSQRSLGLDGRDVFTLGEAPDGTLLAGTNHGIARWSSAGWIASSLIHEPAVRNAAQRNRPPIRTEGPNKFGSYEGHVYAIQADGNNLYAATEEGILLSRTAGLAWQWLPGTTGSLWRFIGVNNGVMVLGGPHELRLSTDGGQTLRMISWPDGLGQLSALTIDNRGQIWAGGREGLFFSTNRGLTWRTVPNFPVSNISSLYFDAATSRILITQGIRGTMVFAVGIDGVTTSWWDTGWHLRMARTVGDHLIGVTLFDGMVLQPRMVASPAQVMTTPPTPVAVNK